MKKVMGKSYQESCFVKTSDWWCGNYYSDGSSFYDRHGMNARDTSDSNDLTTWDGQEYVELKISKSVTSDPKWHNIRVAVWGNDDMGMVKDFTLEQESEARELYEDLQTSPDITHDLLLSKGFEFF